MTLKNITNMKTRKICSIFIAGTILASCLMIYLIMDSTLFPKNRNNQFLVANNQWVHFENRLTRLEKDFNKHHQVMNMLQEAAEFKNHVSQTQSTAGQNQSLPQESYLKKSSACNGDSRQVPTVDVQMLQIYNELKFDNPDGGVWKQGWDIQYNVEQWNRNRKLKVFIVPHSHNDPGWLRTFENYYESQTRNILNNMIIKLSEDRRRKFIWAEVSFFKLWWDEQSKEIHETVRQLIHDNQLEIVAGGWVMTDESVSHWVAQLTQLTEGHQWLKHNLDYVPNSGWAIDPFGLSPTMPLLLKNSGLKNLAIQRVHYSIKKLFAKKKMLEFRWRQLWDTDGTNELFTHVMPFYSYDVPHTCGPDPKICCQFDFARLPHFGISCPWKVAPRTIDDRNVIERSKILLDQYRKKSQLFQTNVLLVPLGDDFRYSLFTEWDAQYNNYQKLFDHMNKNEEFNVNIQFGTLSDYFDAVKDELQVTKFPTLSGDFFTYADREDHYWSGYYTSRPFHKRLDRVLLSAVRSTDILTSIAWMNGHEQLTVGNASTRLSLARQWYSLFQHHDGITGTAKDKVVIDYAEKMIQALNNSAHVLQQSVTHLLKVPKSSPLDLEALYFTLDETRFVNSPDFGFSISWSIKTILHIQYYILNILPRSHHTSLGDKYLIDFTNELTSRRIILYNPIPRERVQVQTFVVSTPFVRVTGRTGRPIQCQISPIWDEVGTISTTRYELSFLGTVSGFGITTYIVSKLNKDIYSPEVHSANITIFNTNVPLTKSTGFNNIQTVELTEEFSIAQRPGLIASFGKSGLLKALKIDSITFPVHLEFVKYGTTSAHEKSGAYLFLPDKQEPDVISMDNKNLVRLVTGPILSKVLVQVPFIRHTCTLFNSPGSDGSGLRIFNEIDIRETQNFELAMRLNTDIVSGDVFYTDSNGLAMIKRQRFSKLPVQANYYPMAASAYIEDKRARLTMVTAQPLGVTSMFSGQLEIMQDRKLVQDDNRGLGQGVTDNLLTNHVFTLLLENIKPDCQIETNNPQGLLSVSGHLASEELLYPVIAMHPREPIGFDLFAYFSSLRFDLPIDLNIISLRVFPIPKRDEKGVGMVLHQSNVDTCWGNDTALKRFLVYGSTELDLRKLFKYKANDWTISEAPLTFHNIGRTLESPLIDLCPHRMLPLLFHKTRS